MSEDKTLTREDVPLDAKFYYFGKLCIEEKIVKEQNDSEKAALDFLTSVGFSYRKIHEFREDEIIPRYEVTPMGMMAYFILEERYSEVLDYSFDEVNFLEDF